MTKDSFQTQTLIVTVNQQTKNQLKQRNIKIKNMTQQHYSTQTQIQTQKSLHK